MRCVKGDGFAHATASWADAAVYVGADRSYETYEDVRRGYCSCRVRVGRGRVRRERDSAAGDGRLITYSWEKAPLFRITETSFCRLREIRECGERCGLRATARAQAQRWLLRIWFIRWDLGCRWCQMQCSGWTRGTSPPSRFSAAARWLLFCSSILSSKPTCSLRCAVHSVQRCWLSYAVLAGCRWLVARQDWLALCRIDY